jgi:hypothetical protein
MLYFHTWSEEKQSRVAQRQCLNFYSGVVRFRSLRHTGYLAWSFCKSFWVPENKLFILSEFATTGSFQILSYPTTNLQLQFSTMEWSTGSTWRRTFEAQRVWHIAYKSYGYSIQHVPALIGHLHPVIHWPVKWQLTDWTFNVQLILISLWNVQLTLSHQIRGLHPSVCICVFPQLHNAVPNVTDWAMNTQHETIHLICFCHLSFIRSV